MRVGPRANAGQRAETPPRPARARDKPAPARRDARDFAVAPRAKPSPQPDTRQLATRERRAQEELKRHQVEEKRRLGQLHDQELTQARAQAERSKIKQHQLAEREAMQKEQQSAAQQLAARQKAQREAVVKPADRAAAARSAKPAGAKQKDKKGKDKKKDRGHD